MTEMLVWIHGWAVTIALGVGAGVLITHGELWPGVACAVLAWLGLCALVAWFNS